MLEWTVWNRTTFYIESGITLDWIIWNGTVLTFNWNGWIRIIWRYWIARNKKKMFLTIKPVYSW